MLLCEPGYQATVFLVTCYVNQNQDINIYCFLSNMLLCEPGYQTTVFLVTCYVNQDIKLLFS